MKADMNVDFVGKRKIYYIISLSIIIIGILASFIFGVKLDIQFKGGTIIKYSYSGTLDRLKAEDVAKSVLKDAQISSKINEDFVTHNKTLVLEIDRSLNNETQASLYKAISEAFAENNVQKGQSNTVSASMGRETIGRSVLAVALASILIIIYIAIRFWKIGGWPAGITAFAALLHDVIVGYVAFVVLRIPLNDNFIAVVLTILGYSINDTIVIYDRIRENRRLYGTKVPFADVVNKSINQSFSRSFNTGLATFLSIAVLAVFSVAYKLDSVTSFAVPMMIGVISGCYSTICIAGPLWVSWETHKEKKAAAEKERLAAEREEKKKKLEASKAKKKSK
ncbi:protein translocase subunit SecF [[Clostridium] cellulosi]|jgi:protein-export membrane protein SecF